MGDKKKKIELEEVGKKRNWRGKEARGMVGNRRELQGGRRGWRRWKGESRNIEKGVEKWKKV